MGNANPDSKTGWVKLQTDDGPLTTDLLESVPFVPSTVWKHVRPKGRGAVEVNLTLSSAQDVRYSVDIRPKAAALALPDTDATLEKVTGLIQVSGSKIRLEKARAELAGGTLAVDGEVDFGPEPTTVTLSVAADKLDLHQLPAEWGLPKDIDGRLKGQARMGLRLYADGHIETSGGGDGVVEDARINDIPVSVAIHLGSTGKRFRFESKQGSQEEQSARPEERRAQPRGVKPVDSAATVCHRAGGGESTTLPAASRRIPTFEQCLLALISYQDKKPVGSAKGVPKKKDDEPTTLSASVKLRDIEISELLEKTHVKLGYKISGKVSAEVAMAVPLTSVTSQAAYEFSGSVTSPALTLEKLTIRDLSAKVKYQNGKLTLTELVGTIDQPGEPRATPVHFAAPPACAIPPARSRPTSPSTTYHSARCLARFRISPSA